MVATGGIGGVRWLSVSGLPGLRLLRLAEGLRLLWLGKCGLLRLTKCLRLLLRLLWRLTETLRLRLLLRMTKCGRSRSCIQIDCRQ